MTSQSTETGYTFCPGIMVVEVGRVGGAKQQYRSLIDQTQSSQNEIKPSWHLSLECHFYHTVISSTQLLFYALFHSKIYYNFSVSLFTHINI